MNNLPKVIILTVDSSFQSTILRKSLFENYLFNTGIMRIKDIEKTCFIIQIDDEQEIEKFKNLAFRNTGSNNFGLGQEFLFYSDSNRNTSKYLKDGGSVSLGKLMPYSRTFLGDKDHITTNGEFYTWQKLDA